MKSDKLVDTPELNSSFMTVLELWQQQNSTIMTGTFALCSDFSFRKKQTNASWTKHRKIMPVLLTYSLILNKKVCSRKKKIDSDSFCMSKSIRSYFSINFKN